MAISTSMSDTFKVELLQGGHCFNTTVTTTATGASAGTTLTLPNVNGLAVGMLATATGLAGTAAIASIPSSTTVIIGPATTAALSTTAITFTGDIFKMALIKATPTGTYNNVSTNSSNYSVVTGNTDEVTGTGYTAAGQALTNVGSTGGGSPTIQAFVNFNPSPSWTTATFSTSGCMIYNTTARITNTAGRACGVFDFGGVQSVSNGTFTVVMPGASSGSAILRVA